MPGNRVILTILSHGLCCALGYSIACLLSEQANLYHVVAYWLISVALGRLAVTQVSKDRPVANAKHIQWTEMALKYAQLLNVEPREVWIVDDHWGTWLARAENDRILVHWKVAQDCSSDAMAFVLAHEVAHYVPSQRHLLLRQVSLVLTFVGSIFAALVTWWALPLVFVGLVTIAALLATLSARTEEFRADRLAVGITSPRLALTLYKAHEKDSPFSVLRKSPTFNSRRRAILGRLKDVYELEAYHRVYIHPPELPK